MNWIVPYVDLSAQFKSVEEEILGELKRVMMSGCFILRDDVRKFESEVASFLGVEHVIGVNSGTDAIFLSLKATGINPGDEVITVAHTFVATIASIVHCGAVPILIDIRDDFNMDVSQLESAVTRKTKAIIPVHMNGHMCDMDIITDVAQRHGLAVIEDAAQAIGARYKDNAAGAFGHAGCFSLHPLKSLGVGGDGGFVSTNDSEFADKLRLLRNHGQRTINEFSCFGYNSRLDNLHAAVALVKIKYLPQWIERRRELGEKYEKNLFNISEIKLPPGARENLTYYDVFNSYVIRTKRRDELKKHLENMGIEILIYWSPPFHHHKGLGLNHWKLPMTERVSQEVLSLPLYPELKDINQEIVIDGVRSFFKV